MDNTTESSTGRLFDVAIVGGSAAGLSAAQLLGRIGRSVAVIDGGNPRNAPAAHMHGFPGFDGVAPSEFLDRARADLDPYDVTTMNGHVASIVDETGLVPQFAVHVDDGKVVRGRRVLVATGITDVLPDIPGLREHWGREVIHCPWCHGWEVKSKRIVVIDTGFGAHQAILFSQLSDEVTLVESEAAVRHTHSELEQLARVGVRVDPRRATRVAVDDALVQIELDDGDIVEADAVVVGARFRANVTMLEGLDVEVVDHASGFGTSVTADPLGQTTRRGIYAAGNVAEAMQQVLHAAANGSMVAGAITADLLAEESTFGRADATGTAAADRAEWDARYGEHDGMWSGEPNGTLVVEVDGVRSGRALDVGCGEGADAVWLAENGWNVTAVDISASAVKRGIEAGEAKDVDVVWQRRDLIDEPMRPHSYDLVTISYPAFRRERGPDVARQLADAVVPGGEFLFVGHDLTDHHPTEHGFDPMDYVMIDDFRNALADGFDITVDETRERPNPPEGAHHVADQVLRATRRV